MSVGRQIMAAVDESIARLAAKQSGELVDGRYDDRRTTGFVVIHRYETNKGIPTESYWYGDEGSRYYNAWGNLDYSVAHYPDKVKAKLALRRTGLASRKGVAIIPVAEAKRIEADRVERYAAALLARVRLLRGETVPKASEL